MQSMSQSPWTLETTASMTAELQEEQAMLDDPDALFEALMKQAMKLSRHEAEEKGKRAGYTHTQIRK